MNTISEQGNKDLSLRLQWQDAVAARETSLPFHEYAKTAELRPPYIGMFRSVDQLQPIDTLKGKLAVAFAVVAAVMFAFGFYLASAIAAGNAIAGGR